MISELVSREMCLSFRTTRSRVGSQAVAKLLGHSDKTRSLGVTDYYVGGLDTAVNAVVAKNAEAGRFSVKTADGGAGYMQHGALTSTEVT